MGNVYQAHISASQKQLRQDSSHGFILKRNVCGLTWRRERREAGSITQSSYAYSGCLEITGTSAWLSELRCICFSSCFFLPPAGIWLWLLGLSERACSLQLQAHFYSITESYLEAARPLSGPQFQVLLLSKAKKTEGLSWAVLTSKRLFLLEKFFLGCFDLQCLSKFHCSYR